MEAKAPLYSAETDSSVPCAVLYRNALLTAISAAGFLLGMNTTRECMKDDDIRLFLGNTLLYEIMPASHRERSEAEEAAGGVCAALENAAGGMPLKEAFEAVFAHLPETLALMSRYMDDNGYLPNGLTFGFACLLMLFAGVRKNAEGQYTLLRGDGEEVALSFDRRGILKEFSTLSCDMSYESLAYAALADVEIWDRDLREVEGLEQKLTESLCSLQLLGVREAMKAAGKKAREASGL